MISPSSAPIASYSEPMDRAEVGRWPQEGQRLLDELAASRGRYALIAALPASADRLVDRLSTDLHLKFVYLGSALAERYNTPPTVANVETICDGATVLTDIDVLLWPALGIPVLSFVAALARRWPIIAVWPGEITEHRARYGVLGHPDHHNERLTDVVVLRPVVARFPDEIPYEIERIAR